jgi:Rhodopirellula transposase DDE domain
MLKVLATLNEAQARWFLAREVLARGRGGLKAMHEATGVSRPTILKGIRELRTKKALPSGERIRRPGGGRKRVEAVDPRWEQALDRILDENTAGDPMSLLRWTNKSTARIAEELTRQGHSASDETVRRRLRALGYSLQANVKNLEEGSGAGRDEQFRYLNRQVKQYLVRGEPVLSVDTKKKERVGNFKNSGQTWRPQGQPLEVNTYDYPHLGEGPAIPYGAYDVHRNEGFVNVGISHDTAEFAVESLRRWWKLFGRRHYPEARRLLLCADGGGSNGSRNRAWKYYLQQLADQLGLEVTVGHYPPGTSKWNKIEHRLFSFISLNWKGQPLVSYETVVNLIGATRTKTGLRVRAELDAKQYEAGIKISDAQMERINLRPHNTNPLWNYTISPRTSSTEK